MNERANWNREKRVAILRLRRGILTELKTRRLQAVRSGPWQLAVTTQANVGPGVRPCGHVDHPVGLWLPAQGPD